MYTTFPGIGKRPTRLLLFKRTPFQQKKRSTIYFENLVHVQPEYVRKDVPKRLQGYGELGGEGGQAREGGDLKEGGVGVESSGKATSKHSLIQLAERLVHRILRAALG